MGHWARGTCRQWRRPRLETEVHGRRLHDGLISHSFMVRERAVERIITVLRNTVTQMTELVHPSRGIFPQIRQIRHCLCTMAPPCRGSGHSRPFGGAGRRGVVSIDRSIISSNASRRPVHTLTAMLDRLAHAGKVDTSPVARC